MYSRSFLKRYREYIFIGDLGFSRNERIPNQYCKNNSNHFIIAYKYNKRQLLSPFFRKYLLLTDILAGVFHYISYGYGPALCLYLKKYGPAFRLYLVKYQWSLSSACQ